MGVLGTNIRRRASRLLLSAALLAAFAATVAACGDSTTTNASTQTPASTAAPHERTWQRVVPGGDCQCSDGSEFNFWVHTANPKKVAFYLQDGGACFSAETCADRDLYQATI